MKGLLGKVTVREESPLPWITSICWQCPATEFDYDQSCPTPFYYDVSIEFSRFVVVYDDVIFI